MEINQLVQQQRNVQSNNPMSTNNRNRPQSRSNIQNIINQPLVSSEQRSTMSAAISQPVELTRYPRGLRPEKIVGANTMEDIGLVFYVKWKNLTQIDCVRREEIYLNDPQLAIDFFKKHLRFSSK
ncbi:Chromo/chromo shadow domain,Chromo shadow domain,Chromo domain-like [Cinara cedri]|uniref:Chromo/chromo shadow domain,Chromo shadow domain,Chromo domain-like n=1 Tax=Cinara cedri TaxID=506608 RepID=A0A5E4M3C1_9HEMI|nr:Chromo/chromo shadow domain,Chromo shadow domain,Chromo domain-like [Cinara cedri]